MAEHVEFGGRWMHKEILDDSKTRPHGEVTFHASQALTGHGCFNHYLKRFGKLDHDECLQCGTRLDNVEHVIFSCDT